MSFVKNALSTVCAFALVIWLLKVTMPRPLPEETVEAESELGPASECSVLFVGPSYVKSQIQPELFDAEAKRIGLKARACKYGLTSLRSYELKWELGRLLARDWPKLELVVIDITLGKRLDFPEQNWFKRRVIDWHTLEAVPWLADYYGRSSSWLKNAPAFSTHAKHVAANYLELGRGAELLARLSEPGRGVRNRRVADTHEQYVERLRALKRARRAKDSKKKYAPSDWPLELRELVRSHDLEAYFLYAPVWRTYRLPERAAKGRDRLVVLDFADPYSYPELYKEEARGRTNHLSGQVAYQAYARALAEALKKRWRRRR